MEHSDSYILLQFVFKQFLRFLKQKNLYGAYISNLNSPRCDYDTPPIFCFFDEFSFISYPFKWSNTHEGMDVWFILNSEWHNVLESFLLKVYASNTRLVTRKPFDIYKIHYHEKDVQELRKKIYTILTKCKPYDG